MEKAIQHCMEEGVSTSNGEPCWNGCRQNKNKTQGDNLQPITNVVK